MAQNKRIAIQGALAQVHSFIAPVRRLPDEILFHIFQKLLGGRQTLLLRLMLVCRKWHGVVSSYPALWAHISILYRSWNFNFLRPGQHLKKVTTFLTRSREVLLDIDIQVSDGEDFHRGCKSELGWDSDDDGHTALSCDKVDAIYLELRTLLNILVGIGGCHMKRWKSFSYWTPSPTSQLKTYCGLKVLQYPAPQLQELFLRGWDPEHSFGEAPRLSRLVLEAWNGLVSLCPTMSSITELIVQPEAWSEREAYALFQLLSLCHRLKVFRLYTVFFLAGQLQNPPKPRLSLPSLQDLEVQSGEIFDYFLATLDLPNLINIDILIREEENYGATTLPQTAWPTWFRTICRLGIELPESNATRLHAFLGAAQGMEVLTIGPKMRKRVEEMLAVDLALCPKLKALRVLSYIRVPYDNIPLSYNAKFSIIPFSTRQT